MVDPISTGLSPLDQIRLAEAEIARKIVAARQAFEHNLVNARTQGTLLKKQAYELGNRKGQIIYKETVSKAEEEARTMVVHAHKKASDLQRGGQDQMEEAVQRAVAVILGLTGGKSE
jgi:vacuolar-type H+-ATPase subunit H